MINRVDVIGVLLSLCSRECKTDSDLALGDRDGVPVTVHKLNVVSFKDGIVGIEAGVDSSDAFTQCFFLCFIELGDNDPDFVELYIIVASLGLCGFREIR